MSSKQIKESYADHPAFQRMFGMVDFVLLKNPTATEVDIIAALFTVSKSIEPEESRLASLIVANFIHKALPKYLATKKEEMRN